MWISPSGEKVISLLIFLTFFCFGRLEKKNDISACNTFRIYHLSRNGGRFESLAFFPLYSKSKAVSPNSLITVPITSDPYRVSQHSLLLSLTRQLEEQQQTN